MKYFCNFVKKMGSGQSPKYLAESIPASAGVMMGVLQQGVQNRINASGEILKDFFILDQFLQIRTVLGIGGK